MRMGVVFAFLCFMRAWGFLISTVQGAAAYINRLQDNWVISRGCVPLHSSNGDINTRYESSNGRLQSW